MEKSDHRQQNLSKIAIMRDQGHGEQAAQQAEALAAAAEQRGDVLTAARAWHEAGVSYKVANRATDALATYPHALRLYQTAGDPLGGGRVARDMAIAQYDQKDYNTALASAAQSVELLSGATPNDDPTRDAELGISLVKQGMILMAMDRYDDARPHLTDGLDLIRHSDNHAYETTALLHLAEFTRHEGDHNNTIDYLLAALGLIYAHDDQKRHPRRIGECHLALAHSYGMLGNKKRGRHHLAQGQKTLAHMSDQARALIEAQADLPSIRQLLQPTRT